MNPISVRLGWRPSEFKSSRSSRAEKRSYEPEDFMDKGVCSSITFQYFHCHCLFHLMKDFSEHGINPKQIKIRSTFDHDDKAPRAGGSHTSGTGSSHDDALRELIRVKS